MRNDIMKNHLQKVSDYVEMHKELQQIRLLGGAEFASTHARKTSMNTSVQHNSSYHGSRHQGQLNSFGGNAQKHNQPGTNGQGQQHLQ